MLVQQLKKLKLKNELVTVIRGYADGDLTGTIEGINDEVLTLCQYTDEGVFDGYTCFFLDQVDEVIWGNREHQAISVLIDETQNKPKYRLTAKSFKELLIEANATYDSVGIYNETVDDQFDIAQIEAFSESWLKYTAFGPKRTLSKLHKLVKADDVSRIEVDAPYQNNIMKLHQKTAEQSL